MADAEKRKVLEDLLKANSIPYDVIEHPAVSRLTYYRNMKLVTI